MAHYFEALSQLNGTEMIEVLLLHNAPNDKELEIINAYLPTLDFVSHIVIEERESLYATWNRGIHLAEGEYITIWNVDDVRFPESVLWQSRALDNHPQAMIAYGDIWVSKEYGVCGKTRTYSLENNLKKDFFHSYHMGCFQMWRKSLHEKIGYYDEQFKCSADFDFQVRAAIHYPLVKVNNVLGIYLEDQPHKLSANKEQELENNIIYLRYKVFQKINYLTLRASLQRYKKDKLLFYGNWQVFQEESPFGLIYKIRGLSLGFVKIFYYVAKRIRDAIS